MNIANVKGSGGLDPRTERAVELPRPANQQATSGGDRADLATISSAGRATAARLDEFTRTLREGGEHRSDVVARAKARLLAGELDTPEAYRATAAAILRGE